jgi:hypothetical protein
MKSISFVSTKVGVFVCRDVDKDSDDNNVDENVRTPTTVSALRDKHIQPKKIRNIPLLRSLDTEETI